MVIAGLSAVTMIKNRNLLILVLAIELLFFAVSVFYAAISAVISDPLASALALNTAIIIVAVAAAEAAVFLAVISILYRNTRSVRLHRYRLKK